MQQRDVDADMMAASLGACAATIMSKAAVTNGFASAPPLPPLPPPYAPLLVAYFTRRHSPAVGVTFTVDKVMQPAPRKIKRIDARFTITGCVRCAAFASLVCSHCRDARSSAEQRQLVETAGAFC
jgi:hypothetical protein